MKTQKRMRKVEYAMKKFMEKLVVKYSSRICGVATLVAAMVPLCCRGQWYQPEEPDDIKKTHNGQIAIM